MTGKAKCKILRDIRRKIAEENDINLITKDCTYQGTCKGTCPKCEAEVRFLEQQLEQRRRLGKTVTVAALAATLSLSLVGCGVPKDSDFDFYTSAENTAKRRKEKKDREKNDYGQLEGDVPDITEGIIPDDGLGKLEGEPTVDPNYYGDVDNLEGDPVPPEEIFPLEGEVAYIPDGEPESENEYDGSECEIQPVITPADDE